MVRLVLLAAWAVLITSFLLSSRGRSGGSLQFGATDAASVHLASSSSTLSSISRKEGGEGTVVVDVDANGASGGSDNRSARQAGSKPLQEDQESNKRWGRSRSALTIALHAQVNPASGVIVGSIITTSGLKRAFQKRGRDVNVVHMINPSDYTEYFNVVYDLVIIEGWFLSIDNFIAVTRATNPQVIILFYCLDPSFPDIGTITGLDVDGYLSNSRHLVQEVLSKVAPAIYLPLAADMDSMAPVQTPAGRDLPVVYIGAGGSMVKAKPMLYRTLKVASNYGLTLYGSRWSEIPDLVPFWQGVLPLDNISYAYSRAGIVLASTIAAQSVHGMVNNRIFEALACGSVVIAERFPALEEMFGPTILYTSTEQETKELIEQVLSDPQRAELMRVNARTSILSKHTWSHRVTDILSFYYELTKNKQYYSSSSSSPNSQGTARLSDDNDTRGGGGGSMSYSSGIFYQPQTGGTPLSNNDSSSNSSSSSSSSNSRCRRSNCLKLAIIVSDYNNNQISSHPDYLFFIKPFLFNRLSSLYSTSLFSESEWISHIAIEHDGRMYWSIERLQSYDVILGVVSSYDSLDRTLRLISHSGDLLSSQRIVCYLFGIGPQTVSLAEGLFKAAKREGEGGSFSGSNDLHFYDFSHYDLVITRISADIEFISNALSLDFDSRRVKHLFGIDSSTRGIESYREKESKYMKLIKTEDNAREEGVGGGIGHSGIDRDIDSDVMVIGELYVCIWQYIQYCDLLVSSSSSASSPPPAILLFGATLDTFISSGLLSPSILSEISNIYALNQNHMDLIVSLFKSSDKVVLNIPYHQMASSSMDITWWPITLATQLNKKLHLIGISDIVSSVLPFSTSWTISYLNDQMDDILLRTHLFPRALSSFAIEKIISGSNTTSSSRSGNQINFADVGVYDGDGLRSARASDRDRVCFLERMARISPHVFVEGEELGLGLEKDRRFNIAVFGITYRMFRPGYDGTLCFSYSSFQSAAKPSDLLPINSANATGLSCNLWPFRYLVPVLRSKDRYFFFRSDFNSLTNCSSGRDGEDCKSVTIMMQNRPFMSLDGFFTTTLDLNFNAKEAFATTAAIEPSYGDNKSLFEVNSDLSVLDQDTCTREIVFYPIDVDNLK